MNSNVTLDLSQLSDEQLSAFALIDEEAAKAERMRRIAFDTPEAALFDLANLQVDLEKFLADARRTSATKRLHELQMLDRLKRILVTFELNGFKFLKPSLD